MPRIRTIKPEFWNDEKLSELAPIDRLVFLGLIGMADDFGRVHHNMKVIDAFIFPNTDDSVRESLANLSRIGRVRVGNASSGMPILEIVNWEKHQRVDKPQDRSALPPIATSRGKTPEKPEEKPIRESFANHSGTVRESFRTIPTTYDQGPTTRDLGEGAGKTAAVAAPPSRSCPSLEQVREYVQEAGLTGIDPEAFVDHYQANGWRQSNGQGIRDWKAAARNWSRRQHQFAARSQPRAGPLKGEDLVAANREAIKRFQEKVENGTAGSLFEGVGFAGGGNELPDHGTNAGGLPRRIGGSVG
jgi:hypothetical protein